MSRTIHLEPGPSADPDDTWILSFLILRIDQIHFKILHRVSEPAVPLGIRKSCDHGKLWDFYFYLNIFSHVVLLSQSVQNKHPLDNLFPFHHIIMQTIHTIFLIFS